MVQCDKDPPLDNWTKNKKNLDFLPDDSDL